MCIRDRIMRDARIPFPVFRISFSGAAENSVKYDQPRGAMMGDPPVSYTHLDVYKRQIHERPLICCKKACKFCINVGLE